MEVLLAAVSVEGEVVSVAVLLAGVVELVVVAGSSLVEGVVGLAGSYGVASGMSSYQMVQMELLVTSPWPFQYPVLRVFWKVMSLRVILVVLRIGSAATAACLSPGPRPAFFQSEVWNLIGASSLLGIPSRLMVSAMRIPPSKTVIPSPFGDVECEPIAAPCLEVSVMSPVIKPWPVTPL